MLMICGQDVDRALENRRGGHAETCLSTSTATIPLQLSKAKSLPPRELEVSSAESGLGENPSICHRSTGEQVLSIASSCVG